MQRQLQIEELGLVALSVFLFVRLELAWWWYPALLLVPDVSMLGYLISPALGSWTYNLIHNRATSVTLYILGGLLGLAWLQLAGIMLLAHSSLDRVMGYGLKYPDAFNHTHLGTIGRRPIDQT